MQMTTERRRSLHRGLRLEYFTLAWNVVEAVVGFIAGMAAGSMALVGFALDSVVEASSAGILTWRLHAEAHEGRTAAEVEQRAVRLVGWAFIALALYVGIRSIYDLVNGARPEESPLGIGLAVVSLVVMPVLAWRKKVLGRELNSRALLADSTQTLLCTYISLVLLVGLVANALLGWWWADPLAGLAIAAFAANEGRELLTAEENGTRATEGP